MGVVVSNDAAAIVRRHACEQRTMSSPRARCATMNASERPCLACSVRGCVLPLERRSASFVCASGHAYDIARSGYLSLLQPQDRRSLAAGDSRATVGARRELLDSGFGAALRATLIEATRALSLPRGARVVDLGCGEGHFLGAVCETAGLDGYGVDLSAHAVERAAKRHNMSTWIAANADRRLPFVDGAFDLALSIDGRRQQAEVARVLVERACFIVAVPAADDLHELRDAVLGEAHAVERAERVEAELAPRFVRIASRAARAQVRLDRAGLARLAAATYRCARTREREVLQRMDELEVTTSHDVLTFQRVG